MPAFSSLMESRDSCACTTNTATSIWRVGMVSLLHSVILESGKLCFFTLISIPSLDLTRSAFNHLSTTSSLYVWSQLKRWMFSCFDIVPACLLGCFFLNRLPDFEILCPFALKLQIVSLPLSKSMENLQFKFHRQSFRERWRKMVAHDVTAAYNYLGSCVTQFSQKREIDRQTSGLTKH